MRVCHIVWGLGMGGIETMLVNIVDSQTHQGLDVHVIVINDIVDPSLARQLNSAVLMTLGRRRGTFALSVWRRLNATLDSLRPDVVHIHCANIYGVIARRWHRRCLLTLHAMPEGKTRQYGLLSSLLPLAEALKGTNVSLIDKIPRVCSISEAVAHRLAVDYGKPSTIVTNGIRCDRFSRRDGRLPDVGSLRLIQVGRLISATKGHDLLLQALATLDPKVTADFIGDGPDMGMLQGMARDLGLGSRVRFLGNKPQDYVSRHLCDYDALVQPSRHEGFGLTVAEAMAAGLPVIVSHDQGPAEVTGGDTFGFTFTNGDAASLAAAVTQVAGNYTEALDRAGRAFRRAARYDIDVTARKYADIYQQASGTL